MLLTGFDLPHYLLDKGFLEYEEVFNQGLSIKSASSRNTGFIVNGDQQNGLFVKQVRSFDQEKIETLRAEATCYWLAQNDEDYANLKDFLPRFHYFDQNNNILIVEHIAGSQDLHNFYQENKVYPLPIAKRIAALLASYHQNIFQSVREKRSFQLFRKSVPPPFIMFGEQMKFVKPRNEAEQQMQQLIVDQKGFTEEVARIKQEWQTSSLIHGDIKPNNFLINRDCLKTGNYDLRLIDWEIADLGDPCWDVAAVFQAYLLVWLMEDAHRPENETSDGHQQGIQLEHLQPSMIEFWKTYCQLMQYAAAEQEKVLRKTTQYCAVKLLHTCFETAVSTQKLRPFNAKMLQLSYNMIQSTDEAIDSLFALKNQVYA